MLHLLNGASVLPAWRAAGLPGEAASWDGLLVEDLDLAPEPALLERARREPRVVLWTEDDLHCAINALPLLSALRDHADLSWAKGAVDERTGAMDAARLRAVFEARREVPREARALAAQAWDAYRAPDPQEIVRFLDAADFAPWTHLAQALEDHLRRFPSVENGLGLVEWTALDHLLPGPRAFPDLFATMRRQPYIERYGLGDETLRALLDASPFVVEEAGRYHLTPEGERVVLGMDDALAVRADDRRLGGARASEWRWDEGNARLIRS